MPSNRPPHQTLFPSRLYPPTAAEPSPCPSPCRVRPPMFRPRRPLPSQPDATPALAYDSPRTQHMHGGRSGISSGAPARAVAPTSLVRTAPAPTLDSTSGCLCCPCHGRALVHVTSHRCHGLFRGMEGPRDHASAFSFGYRGGSADGDADVAGLNGKKAASIPCMPSQRTVTFLRNAGKAITCSWPHVCSWQDRSLPTFEDMRGLDAGRFRLQYNHIHMRPVAALAVVGGGNAIEFRTPRFPKLRRLSRAKWLFVPAQPHHRWRKHTSPDKPKHESENKPKAKPNPSRPSKSLPARTRAEMGSGR